MREWGAEALTALIKAGLAYKHDPPLAQNQVRNSTGGFEKNNQKELKKQKSAFGSRTPWVSLPNIGSFVILTFEKSHPLSQWKS